MLAINSVCVCFSCVGKSWFSQCLIRSGSISFSNINVVVVSYLLRSLKILESFDFKDLKTFESRHWSL